jgi:hypothetical protein
MVGDASLYGLGWTYFRQTFFKTVAQTLILCAASAIGRWKYKASSERLKFDPDLSTPATFSIVVISSLAASAISDKTANLIFFYKFRSLFW